MFHKPDSRFHQPAFSLLACGTTKTAALVVRGTGSIQDVITDIQAMPVPFPSPRGDAESGKGGDQQNDTEDVFFFRGSRRYPCDAFQVLDRVDETQITW